MKKLIYVLLGIVIIFIIIVIGKLVFTSINGEIEIPELKTERLDFGEISHNRENTALYTIHTQKLSSYDFIDSQVNEYVDNLIKSVKEKDYSSEEGVLLDKELLAEKIDTFRVNDNILSVKVTTSIKKNDEDKFNTITKTFNYRLDQKKSITLDDLFKSSYKEKIAQNYTDNYLLQDTQVLFYNGAESKSYSYNSLKEYNKSKLLTASNFELSSDEYNELISKVIDKDRKMVAITFDDGPHATNTDKIISILQKYNARATFFMLGQNVKLYPKVVKSVYDAGNEIGIHTWDHKQLTKLSNAEITSEIVSTSDAISSITGSKPVLVRPPYGSFNNTVKETVNMPLILWNIDSLDWQSRDPEKIVPLVLNSVQDGDIILLHDIHATTVPAAESIIKSLTEQDYQLITVSELLETKGYDTATTKVFYSGRQ